MQIPGTLLESDPSPSVGPGPLHLLPSSWVKLAHSGCLRGWGEGHRALSEPSKCLPVPCEQGGGTMGLGRPVPPTVGSEGLRNTEEGVSSSLHILLR